MTAQTVREMPITYGGDRLKPRIPLDELSASPQRLVQYRFPNGVSGWITTNAEDFKRLLSDGRLHAKRFVGEPQPGAVSIEVPEMEGFIPGLNGEEHLRYRRMAAGDFSVKRIALLRPMVEATVEKYLDEVEAHGSPVDLYKTYCLPIPSEVIARMLGVSDENHLQFQHAAASTIGAGAGTPDADPDEAPRAIAALHGIIAATVELRTKTPADDLISRLIAGGLSVGEICGLCTNLLLAGHETTATNSALAIAMLLTRKDQLQTFLDNPDQLSQSIDELVRFNAIVGDSGAGIPRLVTEDIDYEGYHLTKGDWVMPQGALANIDPAICPVRPLELDVARDTISSVTFGFGAHTCLGQHLARLELGIILTRFFQRFPNVELSLPINEMPWIEEGFGWRMAELSVRW